MQPEAQSLLGDIKQAATLIQQFVAGRSLADFKSDVLLRSAIYWQFAIIGEALSRLRHVDLPSAERISEWQRIIAFRNQILHGYALVDDEITWGIILNKLPVLLREVELLIQPAAGS